MDKLKIYLAAFKKHHFWLLAAVVLIVTLVTWSKASSTLANKYKLDKAAIDSVYRQVKSLDPSMNDKPPPNQKFPDGLNKERTALEDQVLKAWDVFAQDQLKFKWPEAVSAINNLGPHEEIDENLRQNFIANVVKPELKRIFEIVNLRQRKGGGGQNQLNDQNALVEFEGIVNWDDAKRDEIRRRFEKLEIPTTTWVRVKQEDLWVYESLVKIVDAMNKKVGATDQLNAAIKRIDAIDLAQWAVNEAQHNLGAEIELKKDPNAVNMAAPADENPYVELPTADAENKAKLSPDDLLLQGRYIDQNNQPVSAKELRENPPFTEFRQMFVRLRFLMDQTKIPDLLAACADCPYRMETRQVLMYFKDVDSAPAAAEGLGGLPEENAAAHNERVANDVEVEIRGIVYIYSPPIKDKLGKGSAPKPADRALGTPLPKSFGAAGS